MTATRSISLAELLIVEDDPAVLDFRCAATGILLWPSVRSVFLRMAMSDFLYGTPLDGSVSKGVPRGRAIATLTRSLLHNFAMSMTGRCRADVCLMSSGVGNQLVDGRLLNRLSDHFALARHRCTVTVEEHFQWIWPEHRHNQRVILHAPLQAASAIAAKLSGRDTHYRQATRLIDLVSQRAKRFLDWRPGIQRERMLTTMLARKIAGMPIQFRGYEAMLERVSPKVLMTLAGCYGPASALITVAKKMGIVTAEYQHGVVSSGHDGYNFAPTIRESAEYRATLPEYFLSYGSYWNDCFNAPVNMRTVGNPNRDFRIARLSPTADGRRAKEDLLILSDGTEFAIYLQLAKSLLAEATRQGLRVVIRPHPLERPMVTARYGDSSSGVTIDANDDLYTSLGTAHAVVSELSTGLFEAAGLVDKLFVWDTAKARFGFPTFPFRRFASAQELTELLEDDSAGRLPAFQVDSIWAPRWNENYEHFLSSCGAAPQAQLGAQCV